MSIVSVPRRLVVRPPSTPGRTSGRVASRQAVRRARLVRISLMTPAVFVVIALILVGSLIMANERQMQIGSLQRQLMDAQANYAQSVDDFTRAAAPERIATAAGSMHLTVPKQVIQIQAAPLNVPLGLPKIRGGSSVVSRVVTSTHLVIASPASPSR